MQILGPDLELNQELGRAGVVETEPSSASPWVTWMQARLCFTALPGTRGSPGW